MKKYIKGFRELLPTWIICVFMISGIHSWNFAVVLILFVLQCIQLKNIRNKIYEYENLIEDYRKIINKYNEKEKADISLDLAFSEKHNEKNKATVENDIEIKEDFQNDNLQIEREETVILEEETNKIEVENKVKVYKFPPINLLSKRIINNKENNSRELKEQAMRLHQTLLTFGVHVTITDVTQNPLVTRFEMQPEQGTKISKIINLSDDIKLNLAVNDIRIEAPIPGKSAIGIEIPSKTRYVVALRDLIASKEFNDFPSNLACAVGIDYSGNILVADIAKMPHLLIGGTTGSGKTTFINSVIMGILYKSTPDDVKMIMIDTKYVNLTAYNGIPHLLIPVVTDPKKAGAALHWGVAEMTERYHKFSDYGVRNLEEYNRKIESSNLEDNYYKSEKLPQIVVIIDDLSDLMAVNSSEVEENIIRLAQMSRGAGIHLVIATQRPSTDVLTGLIKSNIPSRIAFSVFSSIDSKVILDDKGAEELLGNGDMLFKPQGYLKPIRVQGAFVLDKEILDVVDFLKNQEIENIYSDDVNRNIKRMGNRGGMADNDSNSTRDEHFVEAGRFIIKENKASIGMIQRLFKIGFSRAAKIMDELYEFGVVGEEEGTKPRKILMTLEEFEEYLDK